MVIRKYQKLHPNGRIMIFGGDSVYNLQRYVVKQLKQDASVVNNAQDYLVNLKVEELAY